MSLKTVVSSMRLSWGHVWIFGGLTSLGALLLVASLLIIGHKLEQGDQARLERAVETYLHEVSHKTSKPNPLTGPRFNGSSRFEHFDNRYNPGFVSFMSRREHIVFTNNGIQLPMQSLVSLPPHIPNGWNKIEDKTLSLFTREIEPGLFFQAGMVADNFAIYQSVKNWFFVIFALYLTACIPMVFLLYRWQQTPFARLNRMLAEKNKGTLLIPKKAMADEERLYQHINELIVANSRLITEIQASLDNLAHDLRTPIARLRSTAEYGLQSEKKSDLQDALADCLEESEHIAATLQTMLSVAEAESGTMRLTIRNENIWDNIASAHELYQYTAEDKKITISQRGERDIFCPIDATRMRQVWANLLDNGIKYGRQGGKIDIYLWRENDMACISVTDDGIGISEKEMPRIWERLYRGDRSRSEKGLGLGLNYVRSVIEAHGGSIEVTSVLHQSSCFTIRLKIA